jgi:hypothetical protein
MTLSKPPRRVCVFCGSACGTDPALLVAARDLGASLARAGLGVVYGGATVGLMGAMADGALDAGGHVVGVIPSSLVARELAHQGLPDLRVVATMHERKALMADLADAFVALPGGLGTLDEFFEILTWAQLGLHAKPCALLNVNGYYDALLGFLDHATRAGLVARDHREMILVATDVPSLVAAVGRAMARPGAASVGPPGDAVGRNGR